MDETLFTVHINPYYLRLNFSHPLLEDEESSARYDPSSGYLTVALTKAVKGQTFDDLDLLARLLAPPASRESQGPLIEVVQSQSNELATAEELAEAVGNLSLERREILEGMFNLCLLL